SPLALSAPAPDGTEIAGAEHVHRVLRRWLREADGPQVPVDRVPAEQVDRVPMDDSRSEALDDAPFAVPDPAVQDKPA
ncbi:MAG TPA: hypothetical protein VK545_01685, partial [Streptomyces sp.]|nr:hypothetical protein [Streptomyces sp.]